MGLGFQIYFVLETGYIHPRSEDVGGGEHCLALPLGSHQLGRSRSTYLGAGNVGGCCFPGLPPRVTFQIET